MKNKIIFSYKTINIFIFLLSQVALIFCLYGAMFNVPTMQTLGVGIIGMSTLLLFLGLYGKQKYKVNEFLLFVLILISIISILKSQTLSYKSIINLFSFLEIPIFLVCTKSVETDTRIKIASTVAIISSFLYILCYFSPQAYIYNGKYGFIEISDLTLGFNNPNETGIHLLGTLFVLIITYSYQDKLRKKFFYLIDACILYYLIILTKSRICIIIGAICFICIFLVQHRKKIYKWLKYISLWFPAIVLLTIIFFPDFLLSKNLMGENLDSGRISIILKVIDNMNIGSIILGDFSNQFSNMLNSYLSILVTVGCIALLIYIYILNYSLDKVIKNVKDRYNIIAYYSILLFLIHSSVEAGWMVGGSFYASSFFAIYIMAIDGKNKKVNTNKNNFN